MPRKKREDGQPVERSLKMPAWLSAEVETISGLSGMTQAKVTAILAALVFPETLAGELRQRVYAQLGELLLATASAAYTPHQLEQAALFGVDPADVVIPSAATGLPAADGMPVGEGPEDSDPF